MRPPALSLRNSSCMETFPLKDLPRNHHLPHQEPANFTTGKNHVEPEPEMMIQVRSVLRGNGRSESGQTISPKNIEKHQKPNNIIKSNLLHFRVSYIQLHTKVHGTGHHVHLYITRSWIVIHISYHVLFFISYHIISHHWIICRI